MSDLSTLQPFLGTLEALADHARSNDKPYVQPALKNLGARRI